MTATAAASTMSASVTVRIEPTSSDSARTGSPGITACRSAPAANPPVSTMPAATCAPCRRTRAIADITATSTTDAAAAPSGTLTPSAAAATAPG